MKGGFYNPPNALSPSSTSSTSPSFNEGGVL